jgi:hypothetical protein
MESSGLLLAASGASRGIRPAGPHPWEERGRLLRPARRDHFRRRPAGMNGQIRPGFNWRDLQDESPHAVPEQVCYGESAVKERSASSARDGSGFNRRVSSSAARAASG